MSWYKKGALIDVVHFFFKNVQKFFIDIGTGKLRDQACNSLKGHTGTKWNVPLSNVIFDNMMSRLILTITQQFFDNQCIHFKIKTWKVL